MPISSLSCVNIQSLWEPYFPHKILVQPIANQFGHPVTIVSIGRLSCGVPSPRSLPASVQSCWSPNPMYLMIPCIFISICASLYRYPEYTLRDPKLMPTFLPDGLNRVSATCQLRVRLVTQDLLHSSITVRLHRLSRPAFLSPLYSLFVSALASVLPSSPDDVFLFDVAEDSLGLNVSFSVRERVEHSQDVFLQPQLLRERIYLQRALLARLSTLEVSSLVPLTGYRKFCVGNLSSWPHWVLVF